MTPPADEPAAASVARLCRVEVGGVHEASGKHPRQRLCEVHYDDFMRAKNVWKKAAQRHRAAPDGHVDPGPWDEALVAWTPVGDAAVLVPRETVDRLLEAAERLTEVKSWVLMQHGPNVDAMARSRYAQWVTEAVSGLRSLDPS